ncbi:MAG: oligosaccharide flippase family protein, partial [Candidatus Lokiarchaeota archaeon]|nr:oligosaccharide flippase family protein [Candidatus Lokiarchaeota archaeon]
KFIPKRIKKLAKDDDLNYILKNSRYDVFIQILQFIIGFFISWVLANYTSFELYGNYLLIISIPNFFAFLSFGGIQVSLIQSTSKGYDYFFITSIKKILLYTQLGSLAVIVYSIIYSYFIGFDSVIFISLIISGFYFPFLCLSLLNQNFLFGKEEYKKRFWFSIVKISISNILLIFLVIFLKNLIFYFLLQSIILGLTSFYFIKSSLKLIENKERDLDQDQKSLKYGLMLTKYGIIPLIAANINSVVIGLFFGPVTLAFYTIGISLTNKIILLARPSLSTLLTKYSKEGSKLSKNFIIYLVAFSFILFLGVLIILPTFLQILFPRYLDSISYGIFYSFILLIFPIIIVFGYYFRGKVEQRIIKIVSIIPNVIGLALVIPFLMVFGIYGLILNEFLKNIIILLIYLKNIKKIEFS